MCTTRERVTTRLKDYVASPRWCIRVCGTGIFRGVQRRHVRLYRGTPERDELFVVSCTPHPRWTVTPRCPVHRAAPRRVDPLSLTLSSITSANVHLPPSPVAAAALFSSKKIRRSCPSRKYCRPFVDCFARVLKGSSSRPLQSGRKFAKG